MIKTMSEKARASSMKERELKITINEFSANVFKIDANYARIEKLKVENARLEKRSHCLRT